MFVGEVFNGMVGYLSFSPSLILVTSTEGGPRGFPHNIPTQNQRQFAGGGQWYNG